MVKEGEFLDFARSILTKRSDDGELPSTQMSIIIELVEKIDKMELRIQNLETKIE